MNAIACHEVLDLIELYAAGECAEADRTAIHHHLASCAACARAERESRQLLGLLDIRIQEPDRLRRLHGRLEALDRPTAKRIRPFLPRLAAVAAMLFLALGLSIGFRLFGPVDGSGDGPIVVALGPAEQIVVGPEFKLERAPAALKMDSRQVPAKPLAYSLDLGGKTAAEFRRQLSESRDIGRLPPPPLVNLRLELRNRSDRPVRLFIGAEQSELLLNLSGPGVATAVTKDGFGAAFLIPKTIVLGPGQSYALPIGRLIYGSRQRMRCAYWTQPGEYTLAIRYKAALSPPPRGAPRARVDGHEEGEIGFVLLHGEPIRVTVR